MERDDSRIERYQRELRDLMVAAVDFRVVPASPPTQVSAYRADFIVLAEYLSETHLPALAPAEAQARVVWAEVADDICASLLEAGRPRLRPAPRAVRIVFRSWFKMSWPARIWFLLRGGRVPRPGGRPLGEVLHPESGAAT